MVIREAPPQPPQCVGRKVITISGKRLPPAPRKVVIERLAPVPSKPQSVMIERWLPYAEQKRRVIYQKPPPDPVVCKPRNVIIQWEAPEVCVRKEIKHLGVVCANPCDYVKRYGPCLKQPCDLPQFVKDIPPQCGIELAANKKQNPVHELCGDVCALTMVNLDCEGLGIYKNQVKQKCGSGGSCCSSPKSSPSNKSSSNYSSSSYSAECSQGRCSSSNSSQSTNMSSSTMYASVSGYGTASGSASNAYATPSYDSCSPPCPAPCPPTSSSYESPTARQQRSSNNNTGRRHHHHHSHSHSHSHQHNHSQNSYNHSNHTSSPTSGGSSKNSSRRSSPKYSVVNISQSPTYY